MDFYGTGTGICERPDGKIRRNLESSTGRSPETQAQAMDMERLIEVAFNRTPTRAEVEEAASLECVSVETLLNRFARRVAERYLGGVYSFGDADMAMNELFACSTIVMGTGLPEFAWKVFGAFDGGELTRPGVPEDQQGEALTRTLLSVCLQTES